MLFSLVLLDILVVLLALVSVQLARDVLHKHNHHHHYHHHSHRTSSTNHSDRLWLVDHYLGKDMALCLPALKHTALAPLRRLFSSSGR